MITSKVNHTHQERGRVEAWQYTGQEFEAWPDWLRSHYEGRPGMQPKTARIGNWAMRDDEGYFWRWIRPELFADRYEPIRPMPLQDHAEGWEPVSAAPKDGSTVLFKIELAARAYWDSEMKDWVLNYPINMECVRNATGCALSTRPMVAEERTDG